MTQRISTKLAVGFCALLIFAEVGFTQEKKPTVYPYGGVPDKSRKTDYMDKIPLNFNRKAYFFEAKFANKAYFTEAKFDSMAYFSGATFDDEADFRGATFDDWADFRRATYDDVADFNEATFDSVANFSEATFDSVAYFFEATFDDVAYFNRATFDDEAYFFEATFDSVAYFSEAKFDDWAYFNRAKFDDEADFRRAKFASLAYFNEATFDGVPDFSGATFDGVADFSGAKFDSVADFVQARFGGTVNFTNTDFREKVDFEGSVFSKVVNLAHTTFEKGLDLRRAMFDSVQTIYVDHQTVFPVGQFQLYWHQFKAVDNLRIRLYEPPMVHMQSDSLHIKNLKVKIDDIAEQANSKVNLASTALKPDSLRALWKFEKARLDSIYKSKFKSVTNEHYQRIETFYHRLRDNFLKDDKASADAVLYELGWQRKEILGEFWWKMYGFFFGYGFQPWRFLLFVVLPNILIFATIWYLKYFGIVATLLNTKFNDELITRIKESKGRKVSLPKLKTKIDIYDHSKVSRDISLIYRAWYVIYFSASVLFGIRFKKDWFDVGSKRFYGYRTFLRVVTLEWLLGIGLIVTFVILVKGARFGFIRDLLGF